VRRIATPVTLSWMPVGKLAGQCLPGRDLLAAPCPSTSPAAAGLTSCLLY
jgi:hypothetical protein